MLTVLNCRFLSSHIPKAVLILCLLFPVQKPLNESEETNKHILGRNGLLTEPGAPETHKKDSDEGCTNREKKL